jgi:hypothetical protein
MSGSGLFGSTTLDVAIGLAFVYLLLAIICTTINEWIAGILKTRSTTLASGIRQLLDHQPGQTGSADVDWFLQQFYSHPLITGMTHPGDPKAHPSYIPAPAFATAVMDIATQGKTGVLTFADLEASITKMPEGDVRTALLSLIQNANHNLNQAQRNIENWFNDSMDQVSGWYKRRTQLWTAVIAIILTLAANADTLQIAKTLWTDPTRRAQLVEQAKGRYTDGAKDASSSKVEPTSQEELNTLGQVMGWSQRGLPKTFLGWVDHVFGWALSVVAISLGAPFWFDTLNRFMRVRNGSENPREVPPDPTVQPPSPPPAPPPAQPPQIAVVVPNNAPAS